MNEHDAVDRVESGEVDEEDLEYRRSEQELIEAADAKVQSVAQQPEHDRHQARVRLQRR